MRDRRGPLGSARYETLGENFGGKPSIPITIPLEREPGGKPELVVLGQAYARDSFRLRLR